MKDVMKAFGTSVASILGMFAGIFAVGKIIEFADHKKSQSK